MPQLLKWWKDSADKQYTVSDATDTTAGWGPLPVVVTPSGATGASSTALSILGTVNGVSTLTRLSNTTAYTAGDEVSDIASSSANPWVFANAATANGGAGWITKVRLQSSDPLCVSAVFRLYIFDAAPTMVGDNLAYALLGAEFASREGYIDIGPMVTSVGTGVASIDQDTRKRYVCASASTSLWGILVIQNAYTPLSGGLFRLEITVDRD